MRIDDQGEFLPVLKPAFGGCFSGPGMTLMPLSLQNERSVETSSLDFG
jgi:hypothetical protein